MGVASVVCVMMLAAEAQALAPETVAPLKRGTVLLRVGSGEGSGFFVEEGLVLTNAHVVKEVGVGGEVAVVLDSGTREQQVIAGRVRLLDEARDLAAVDVPRTPGRALSLRTALPVETQEVVAVGFPLGSLRAFGVGASDPPVSLRPGAVTAIHRGPEGAPTFIEHNTNMQQGSSGGPLVDASGAVVGVNVGFLSRDPTTKLAIPGALAQAFLARARQTAVSRAPEGAPRHAESAGSPPRGAAFAQPFLEGKVREAVAGGGTLYVLLKDGSVRAWREDSWTSTRSGRNNVDLAVDDQTGDVYVVEGGTGHLYRLASDGWALEGDGRNARVAASGGRLWVIDARGSLLLRERGQAWRAGDISGIEDVKACSAIGFLRAGKQIWLHDGEALANEGKALRDDVRDVSCEREHVYAVMQDGTIVDFTAGKKIDAAQDNTAVFALPGGVMASTTAGALWYWSRQDGGWTRLGP